LANPTDEELEEMAIVAFKCADPELRDACLNARFNDEIRSALAVGFDALRERAEGDETPAQVLAREMSDAEFDQTLELDELDEDAGAQG